MPIYPLLFFPVVTFSSMKCQIKSLRSRENNGTETELVAVLAQRCRKPKSITPTHKTEKEKDGSGT